MSTVLTCLQEKSPMPYDPDRHDRQSIRLPDYDYRSPGVYFVTVCAADRRCLFGEATDGQMIPNDCGIIVSEEWRRTEMVRDRVVVDTFVLMPNHTHGVIVIKDPPGDDSDQQSSSASDNDAEDDRGRDSSPMNPYHDDEPRNRTFGGAIAGSLSTIMRQFKSMVTKRINRRRDTPDASVWQRNFYERVVRTRGELERVRTYIRRNPAQWDEGRIHPDENR